MKARPIAHQPIRRAIHESLESRRMFAATPLISGTSVDATIGSVGETDAYAFTIKPGQRFYIAAIGKTGGGNTFTPTGTIIAPSSAGESNLSFTSTTSRSVDSGNATRTYTLNVADAGNDTIGTYRLTVFISNGPQHDDDAGDFSDTTDDVSANSGQRYGATPDIGDLDVWRLDVTKGQAITVTVVENDANDPVSPLVWLVDAQGRRVTSKSDQTGLRLSATANSSGAYYAVVANSSSTPGIYGITLTRVAGVQYTGDPDTGALAPNVTRTGDLPRGDGDVFTLYLDPGQTINLDVQRGTAAGDDGSLDPLAILYTPSGATAQTNARTDGTAVISATAGIGGTYYVALFDNDSNGGGTYGIHYTLSGGSSSGVAPADGRISYVATDDDDSLVVRRHAVNGVDTLEITAGDGSSKRYYAPEVKQLAISTEGGGDKVVMTGSNIRTYVSAGAGDDTVYGTSGNDSLTGGAGRNRLYGGGGDDRLNGSNGRDILSGEAGNDRLYGQGGGDLLDGGGNNDRVFGGDGDDELLGGNGVDKLYGGAGNDTLTGGAGKDALRGEAGNDRFRALDKERDELFGGDGTDAIDGHNFDNGLDVFPASDVETIP